jgi:uncharacterized protein YhdP
MAGNPSETRYDGRAGAGDAGTTGQGHRRSLVLGRPARFLLEFIATIAVVLVVGVALLAWRLSAGPVSLSWFRPTIERALSGQDGRYSVFVQDVVVTWGGWDRFLQFHLVGINVLDQDGRMVVEAPEATAEFAPRAMLVGRLGISQLTVRGLHLSVVRSDEGVHFGHEPGETTTGEEDFLASLLLRPNGADPLADLRRIAVVSASIAIDDRVLGRVWNAPSAQLAFIRSAGRLQADVSLDVDLDGRRLPLSAAADHDLATGRTVLRAALVGASVQSLAPLHQQLAVLASLEGNVSLRADATLDRAGRIVAGAAALELQPGQYSDAALFAGPLQFSSADLRLQMNESRRVEFTLSLRDYGAPLMTVQGALTDAEAQPLLALTAETSGMPTGMLSRLWPLTVAAGGRSWVTQNITDGQVNAARLEMALRAPADWRTRAPSELLDATTLERFDARIEYSGLSVNYRAPMPQVRGVSGAGRFTTSTLTLDIAQGSTGNLRVERGRVTIGGLDRPDQDATIDLNIRGPVREAMQLIESQPLQYASKIGRAPQDFAGQAAVQLRLQLPLVERLRMQEVQVAASATISNFQLRRAALERDVTEGEVALQVDGNRLELNGAITLAQASAQIRMERNFLPNAPFVNRVRLETQLTAEQLAGLGFDPRPYLDGPMGIRVQHTELRNGAEEVVIEHALERATGRIAQLGWEKPAGAGGATRIVLALAQGRLRELRSFEVRAAGLEARGSGQFQPDGRSFRQLRVDSLVAGNNRLRGAVTFGANGPSIELAAQSLDLEPVLRARRADPARPAEQSDPAQQFSISAQAERVMLGQGRTINRVRFAGRRAAGRWVNADLEAAPQAIQGEALLHWRLRSEGNRQSVTFGSADAGALLSALGISRNIRGGRLRGQAASDLTIEGHPVVGRIEAQQFHLLNAPWLAQALNILMVAGIGDAMRGDGVPFTRMDGQFAFGNGRLQLRDVSAAGPALGITTAGAIDLDGNRIDLAGVIVPAYLVNNIIANIPLIGPAIAGGRGGGLFGVNYTARGPLDNPQVDVNPLSALAPGMLRDLFRGMPVDRDEPPAEPVPQPR